MHLWKVDFFLWNSPVFNCERFISWVSKQISGTNLTKLKTWYFYKRNPPSINRLWSVIHLPLRADRHRNRTRIPRKRLRIESRRWTWRSPCFWSFSSCRLEWYRRQAPACRIEWRWSRPYPQMKRWLAFGIQWWIVTRAVGAYCKRQGHIEYSDRS